MVKLFVFVSSWWQHSANLASYEQQDAHEFFISMLNTIHEKEGISRNGSKGNEMLKLGFFPAILLSHRVGLCLTEEIHEAVSLYYYVVMFY
jgi:hypothetical protein